MAMADIRFLADDSGGRTVVEVEGDLDTLTVPQLADAVKSAAEAGTHLTLDLRGVQFCGSSALEYLADLQKTTVANGGSLILAGVPHTLRRLLDLTALDKLFTIRDQPDTSDQSPEPPAAVN